MAAVTIKGLEPLLAYRTAGKLPSRDVLLWFDREPAKWAKYPDLLGKPEGIVTPKDDLRVLLRLDVTLVTDQLTSQAVEAFERIKEFANSIVFVVLSLNDGTVWDRKSGERSL